MTIQGRLTFLYRFLTTFLVILLSVCIYFFSYEFTYEDFYKRLEARVRIAAKIYFHEDQNSNPYAELRDQFLEKLPSQTEYILKIGQRKEIIGGKRISLPDKFFETAFQGVMARERVNDVFYAGRLYKRASRKYLIIVSATDPYGLQELEDLKIILISGVILSTILIFIIGRMLSAYTFKPIRDIIEKVNQITAQNIHLRLDKREGDDEIAELSQTFNDMLDRLETAFETRNNFVSNASHELRTPLTVITSETELALNDALKGKANLESLRQINYESERLKHILTSLLKLAQSGFDGKKQQWEKIRVDELLLDAMTSINQLNPSNNVQIDFDDLPEKEEDLTTNGNSNLLKLAINNIIVNAIKYSDNKPVVVSLRSNGNAITVSVLDKGIGIPADELQQVFVPFFRASNTTDYEGYGVGLPLSLNIIRLHKGSISIQTKEEEGTEIQVLLPVTA